MKDMMDAVKLGNDEITKRLSEGSKSLIRTAYSKDDGVVGGYHSYFSNLSRGRYKEDPADKERGWGGPRTWKFILKHMAVADKILSSRRPVSLLDIGCSSGFMRKVLESNVFSREEIYYYGLDAREHVLLSALKGEGGLETAAEGDKIQTMYVCHDARKGLPFHDKSFDFVVSFEMIKYLEKREALALLAEVSRVLKDGGTFFLSTAGVHSKPQSKKAFPCEWRTEELRGALDGVGLRTYRVYGSEADYSAVANAATESDRPLLSKMDALFPKEITAAVAGFFVPDATDIKMIMSRKGALDQETELASLYPGARISRIQHRGNSPVFSVGNSIVKYVIPTVFEKQEYVAGMIRKHTGIRIPKIVSSRRSDSMDGYILEMKATGKTATDEWSCMNGKAREETVKGMAKLLKEMHGIRMNPDESPLYMRLYQGSAFETESTWKREVERFLDYELAKPYQGKAEMGQKLESIFKANISHVRDTDYRLVHKDLNLSNIFVGDGGLTMALDFETSFIGDPIFDVAATASWMPNESLRSVFLGEYGTDGSYREVSRIYRLILFLTMLRVVSPKIGCEQHILDFIENGTTFDMEWLGKSTPCP